jgi:hypothetical protein
VKEISPQDSPKYGIMLPLLRGMGGEAKVLESRHLIDQMKAIAEEDLQQIMAKLLTEPTNVPNWESQIALLLGEAKHAVKFVELYTIKER